MYEDIDAMESSNWPPLSNNVTGSDSRNPSLDSKRTKHANANEKNPKWLRREHTYFVRPIAMKYYVHRYLKVLEHEFPDTGMDGYVELCKDLCWEFMREFDASKKFNNYLDYWDHMKWLDNIAATNTTNVVKGTFEVLY
jgi:hypothetical protein